MKKALQYLALPLIALFSLASDAMAQAEIIATPTEFTQGRTDILTIAGVVLGIVVVMYLFRKVKGVIK
jgi:hypothetical protein